MVLDDCLSISGDSIPKWEQRSWVGAYLGNSKYHASSVPLVLNLKTGHVTSPSHVCFDDDFTLVESLTHQNVPYHWSELYKKRGVQLVDPSDFIDPTMTSGSTIYDSTQRIAWQPVVDIGDRFYLTKPNPSCTSVSASNTQTTLSSPSTPSVVLSVVTPPTLAAFEGDNPLITNGTAISHSTVAVPTIDTSFTSIDAPQLVSEGAAMSISSTPVSTS